MKKIIIIFGAVLLFIVAMFFLAPVFFKSSLINITKSTLNKELNADVQFSDLKLSFLSNFPKATIKIEDVTIIGKGEFQADTLLNVASVQAKMELLSVFKKSGKSLDELILNQPKLHLRVNELGATNWDIVKNESGNPTNVNVQKPVENNPENVFELQLNKILLNDASVVYSDEEAKILLQFLGINFDFSGNMYGTTTGLNAEGIVNDFMLKYNEVEYISNTSLETKTLLNMDFEKMEFWVVQNELLFNRLPLEIIGSIKIPSDSVVYNLQLKTKESNFNNFLALVPPVYDSYLKDIETSGSATVEGQLSGIYFEDNYPAFSLNLNVDKGTMQFAGLPRKIEKIKADIEISKPQGDMNLAQVNIKAAHAEINNSPVDLKLSLTNLFSDVQFDGSLVGAVNFNDVKDAFPVDSINVSGAIDANLFVKGNYAAIENEQYDKIKSVGMVQLNNFIYDSPGLSQKILVPTGLLEFSPQFMILRDLKMKVGQSDFSLTGKVSNYLNYVLKTGTINGDLVLNSSFVNLNELLRLKKKTKPETAETIAIETTENKPVAEKAEEAVAFDIPKNIDLTFRSNIKKAVLDRMPITNINGLITARNGKLILNGLNMNMLDGELKLSGSYENTPQNQPLFDFGFNISNFDIPVAYKTLSGLQKMMPVAGRSTGKISTVFKMNGSLNSEHKILARSVNGNGQFQTQNVRIVGSPIFNQLKGILKTEKLQNVTIDDLNSNFEVENGNINLKPFKTKVSGQETLVQGNMSAENIMEMRLDFKINRDAFGVDIQNILSVLPGNEKIKVVPAGVDIIGPVGNPEVKMDLSETRKTITDATKGELQDSLDKLGKGLKKLFGN